MKPVSNPDKKPVLGDMPLERPLYESGDTKSVFNGQENASERDPNAFGEVSNDEIKDDFADSAKDKDTGFIPFVPLPPYVVSDKSGAEAVYALVIPDNVRPPSWPYAVPLGGDGGLGPTAIFEKAWATYGHLLHVMHTDKKAEVPVNADAPQTTFPAMATAYRESDTYKKLEPEERINEDKRLSTILQWSEDNDNPAMSDVVAEHILALMMAYDGDNEGRLALRTTLAGLYAEAMDKGYVSINPAAAATMPHPEWEKATELHPIPYPINIFTKHGGVAAPAPAPL